jgi:hypothetical protein
MFPSGEYVARLKNQERMSQLCSVQPNWSKWPLASSEHSISCSSLTQQRSCGAVPPRPRLPRAPGTLCCSHVARLLTIRCIQTQVSPHIYQLAILFTDSSPHQTPTCSDHFLHVQAIPNGAHPNITVSSQTTYCCWKHRLETYHGNKVKCKDVH